VRQLFTDTNAFFRKALQDNEFVQSDTFDEQKDDFMRRWRAILDAETPESRKLKEDTQQLQRELEDFQVALKEDKNLRRLAAAYEQFGKDTAKATAEAAKISQTAIPWMWTDVLNVYLPLVLEYVKGIPIPR
jgi:molecular chaperone GrpE (heat shock protein)